MERRVFPPGGQPLRVLITGGASCPDGLIQQVVARINAFFPDERLRQIEAGAGGPAAAGGPPELRAWPGPAIGYAGTSGTKRTGQS